VRTFVWSPVQRRFTSVFGLSDRQPCCAPVAAGNRSREIDDEGFTVIRRSFGMIAIRRQTRAPLRRLSWPTADACKNAALTRGIDPKRISTATGPAFLRQADSGTTTSTGDRSNTLRRADRQGSSTHPDQQDHNKTTLDTSSAGSRFRMWLRAPRTL